MNIPSFDLILTKFYSSESGFYSENAKNSCIEKLENAFHENMVKCQRKRPLLYRFKLNDIKRLNTNIMHYCLHKLQKYQTKYQKSIECVYSFCASSLSHIIVVLRSKKSYKECNFEIGRYLQFLENLCDKEVNVAKYTKKIQCMNSYALNLTDFCYMFKPKDQVLTELSMFSQKTIIQIEYTPLCPFDDTFSLFLLAHYNQTISHIVEECIAEREIKLGSVNDFYKQLKEELQIHEKNQAILLRCSLFRFIFDQMYDRIYTQFYPVFNGSTKYLCSCRIAKYSTPRQLKVSENLIKNSHYDEPMMAIAKNSQDLINAISDLRIVQFFNNPLDICYCIFKTMKSIEKFVFNSTLEEKYGQFVSMFQMNKSSGSTMSFDDFFSIFWPIFAVDPPIGSPSISIFLNSISGLTFSSTFQFARLLFCSTVEYTQQIDEKEFYSLEKLDDDPLGIT